MMRSMEGVVTIVQESRFQLADSLGVSHLFILGPGAAAETAQLAPLQERQARIRVGYVLAPGTIGHQATSITVLG